MANGRSEREEEAFQSMYEAIKSQSIHAAPPSAANEEGAAPPEGAQVVAIGPDGKPVPVPAAAPAYGHHMPRERDYDDTEVLRVASRMWLVSFCDLMSLMLCFFVMMYAMRDPDMAKITSMLGGGSGSYAGASESDEGEAGGDQEGPAIARVEYGEALNLDYLQGVLKNALAQAKLQDDVNIADGRDHLKLTVDDPFANDKTLDSDGSRIAKGLAERLNFLSNRITVVAHGSDWDEVVARSGTFADVMREAGYRKPFTVIGELTSGPDIEIRVEADDGRAR